MIFEIINPDREYNPETLERFDFANSKYLSKLFISGDDFKRTFIELLDVLDESDKSVKELLNSFSEDDFKKRGIFMKIAGKILRLIAPLM